MTPDAQGQNERGLEFPEIKTGEEWTGMEEEIPVRQRKLNFRRSASVDAVEGTDELLELRVCLTDILRETRSSRKTRASGFSAGSSEGRPALRSTPK